MPNITDKEAYKRPCTGCGICSVVCPHDCIAMELNADGFVRPKVNGDCIGCGLCKKTCIKYAEFESGYDDFWHGKPVYSFKSHRPMTLATSSSGAFVTEVYTRMLEKGYTLCGAVYNCDVVKVSHILTTRKEDIPQLAGSKYLPSFTHLALSGIKCDKDSNYVVVGTPCQIYGLHQWAVRHHCRDRFFAN